MAKGVTNRKKRTKVLIAEAELASVQNSRHSTLSTVSRHLVAPNVVSMTYWIISLPQTKGSKKILPKEKRRYVIYLRKSTDDEAKQVRSLPDQRIECLKLADRLEITVRDEDIIEESKSAKKSGERPLFDDMLQGFRTGKYHGLISWSPDRVSRNMKEAGEVIEMIDDQAIQDLAFVTYQFDNSPNGKMMLGILFATSKHYSGQAIG